MSAEIQTPSIPLSSYSFRLLTVNIVAHPFDYARFLIQIGYEPLPAYPATSIFGRRILRLPNVLSYLGYIRQQDGWFGLYRGLFPKIVGHLVGSAVTETVRERLQLEDCRKLMSVQTFPEVERYLEHITPGTDVNDLWSLIDEFESIASAMDLQDVVAKIRMLRLGFLLQTLKKVVIERFVFTTVSQPFVVISARMMASFVGKEEGYSGFFSTIGSIICDDGVLGFFSGYIPRLLGDVTAAVVSTLVIYGVNNYLVTEKELQNLASTLVVYYINAQVHPMSVVSSCMAVNNTSLKAGKPPQMNIFYNWVTCWQHLRLNNQLYRGSTMFIRNYYGPPSGSAALSAH